MVNSITLALGLAVVALVVYAAGIDRTKSAASTTALTTKRVANSTVTHAAAAGMAGVAAGDVLLQFVASDPATLIAGITGAVGTLGLAGAVDISATQFALIVAALLVGYYALFHEATEEDDD